MKKVFLILITLFIFVGCANSPNDESKDYFEGLYDHAFCGPEYEEFCGYKFCKSTEKNKVELEFYKLLMSMQYYLLQKLMSLKLL